jgi:REP element-mobilizing transposase RayT
MPRKVRIEFKGARYHMMCRGDRREAVFHDNRDREGFLETLGEVCARCGFLIYSYVLMGNHYHLLLETPKGNLVAGMKWFQGTHTAAVQCETSLAREPAAQRLLDCGLQALGKDWMTSGSFARTMASSRRWPGWADTGSPNYPARRSSFYQPFMSPDPSALAPVPSHGLCLDGAAWDGDVRYPVLRLVLS